MFDTSMSWLMTRLNPNPLMVSAVQVATMGPMFLLTVPAGALADVADPRRLLIVAQVGVVAVGAVFAGFVTAHMETPAALLATVFLLGAVGALAAPAWQTIMPMLAPREELDDAIALQTPPITSAARSARRSAASRSPPSASGCRSGSMWRPT